MLDVLEKPVTVNQDAVPDTAWPRNEPAPQSTVHDQNDGLLATAGPLMAAAYAAALGIVALTFTASSEALFVIAISSGFAIMFFALPWLMLRIRASHDDRFLRSGTALTAPMVETFTGAIRRGEALAQMVIVPLAVVVAFSAFALISTLARP